MKKFPAFLFFIQCLFLMALPDLLIAAENSVGRVIGINGTIEYQSGALEPVADAKPGDVQPVAFEKWQKVEFHQPVFEKDKFRTSRKSRLKILLADNSLIAVGPNSEIKVESYLFNKDDKFRQGVIGLAHGLSMYIVNKSQTSKNSSLKIVTQTANIGARGTQGFISAAINDTYTANKVGTVSTSNVLPSIPGVVELGPLMGNHVPLNQPPTPAVPLTPDTMNRISNLVMGLMDPTSGGQSSGGSPLIEIQETEAEPEGEDEGFTQEFFAASEGGLAEFFVPENNPFSVIDLDTCSF